MNHRIASTLAFTGSVAAATVAAALMSGNALAETPTIDDTKFVSSRSRAEVRDEVLAAHLSSAGGEWSGQQTAPFMSNGLTRAQARSDYIAARDEVMARNSEGGGSVRSAVAPSRSVPVTFMAGQVTR
jgi:hypothetical protein